METLAAAIVGALIAGARDVSKDAVRDAYEGAKATIAMLLPTFDLSQARQGNEEAATGELKQRLGGLMEDERASIVAACQRLADAAGELEAARTLGDQVIARRINAGEDVKVSIDGSGSDALTFEDIKGGRNVTINKTTRPLNEKHRES